LEDDLKIQLDIASTNYDKLANNINQSCFDYNAYGKHIASKIMKTSPDAVVQLALQLAYYGQQGTFCGVYESVSMRHYKRGRTETGRCLSVESKAFVLAMVDSKVSQEEKKDFSTKQHNRMSNISRKPKKETESIVIFWV